MSFPLPDQLLSPATTRGGIEIFLLLLTVIASFLIYWFTIEAPGLKARFYRGFGRERGSLLFFIFNKLWGSLWFGLVSSSAALFLFSAYRPQDFVLRFTLPGHSLKLTFLWSITLIPLVLVLAWLKARKIGTSGGDFGRYPEIAKKTWSPSTVVIHIAFWSLYLFSYELMFRGILLFPLAESLGPWPAIGINIALYSAVHTPKGAQEAVGALFLGFVLCLITLQTGNIAVAFAVHAVLAISNGLFAVHYRRDMGFSHSTGS